MLKPVASMRRWRLLGWGDRLVRFGSWDEAAARLSTMAVRYPELRPVVDIVESVIVAGAQGQLAVVMSMTDLIVINRDSAGPPFDPVFVRLLPVLTGGVAWVRISHASFTGRDDQIDAPPARAVAVFWQFMYYKFDILPAGLDLEATP